MVSPARSVNEQASDLVSTIESLARGRARQLASVNIIAPDSPDGRAIVDAVRALLERRGLGHADVRRDPGEGPIRVVMVAFST